VLGIHRQLSSPNKILNRKYPVGLWVSDPTKYCDQRQRVIDVEEAGELPGRGHSSARRKRSLLFRSSGDLMEF